MEKENVDLLKKWILNSRFAVVLTGAGVSVPSGIPDFRSKEGVYSKWGQEIFDIDLFYSNPDKFYKFAKEELLKMLDAEPNTVHFLLAKLENMGIIKGVITQNIDNLHKKAGSKNVAEIHGNVRTWTCIKCHRRFDLCSKNDREDLLLRNFRCNCSGITKPDIVFFGEMLPLNEYSKAEGWTQKSDLFITLGTSLIVYPAAQLPLQSKRNNAKLVVVNKGKTPIDDISDLKFDIDLVEFANELGSYL
ncbi:MAG: NAD-dependent protein deacylase [Fervidobacterium sp.]